VPPLVSRQIRRIIIRFKATRKVASSLAALGSSFVTRDVDLVIVISILKNTFIG
jgi:hypothetical protein